MADKNTPKAQKSWIASTIEKWIGGGGGTDMRDEVDHGPFAFGDQLSTKVLTGGSAGNARARQTIYDRWQVMLSDPIVSGAMRIHVTAALGGHETSGDVVFVETRPEFVGNADAEAVVKDVNAALNPLFNKVAAGLAFNAAAYGDGFARIFSRPGEGVVDLSCDETMLPPLVAAYEQGSFTRICLVAVGPKMREKLTPDQIVRMKMPRLNYVPQPMAIEKTWRAYITENDPDKLPLMPALAGGSFLVDAEQQYGNFAAALNGLVGQRILDSIDESMFTAQVQGMTKEQRQEFLGSLKTMLTKSRDVAAAAISGNSPMLGRIRHILPVFGDKQLLQVQAVNSGGGSGGGRAGSITVDDVVFHAKLLSGALGIDLSLLGFSDMLSGGLGDGGFFRTSVQAAERSRVIRVALSEALSHVARVHMLIKSGRLYSEATQPWQINFYGGISALETERQRTQADAMNTGAVFIQTMTQARDLGIDEKALVHFLSKIIKLDEEDAKLYAKALVKAKPAEDPGGFGGGGGGFGGGADPAVAPGATGSEVEEG